MRNALVIAMLVVGGIAPHVCAMGQEDFGSHKLSPRNYEQFKDIMALLEHGQRVYHCWVNGNEQFFYRDDVDTLNESLQAFALVGCNTREVLLRPGPALTTSFHEKKIDFDWDVHIVGGIAGHMSKLDQGEKVWNTSPMVTIYISERIPLEKLKIPDGVSVIELSDLKSRYREALTSREQDVRGWGSCELARLDRFDDDSLATIAKMIDDPNEWVRSNVFLAIAAFGRKAQPLLPKLRDAKADADVIKRITEAPDDSEAEKQHNALLKSIHDFCKSLPTTKPASARL
jgi:hypothetical protein